MTSEQEATLPLWFDPASWRDRIARLNGSRAWFCRWVVHRVEALVSVRRQAPLKGLHRALLLRIAHDLGPGDDAIDPLLLAGLRRDLVQAGLIASAPERWTVTEAGADAIESGTFSQTHHERRTFHFLIRNDQPLPALFLPVTGTGLPPSSAEQFAFEPDWLRSWVALPPEQKRTLGFPEEITGVEVASPDSLPDWRRVILASSREGCFLLVELPGPEGATSLHGYLVGPSDDALPGQPAFTLGPGWQQFLPELNEERPRTGPSQQSAKRIYPGD